MVGKSALLIMDAQNGIVERYATAEQLKPLVKALETARRHQVGVIFVRVAFRPGYPDISLKNRSFSLLKSRAGMTEGDESTQIWHGLQPRENEVVVVKRRVSAFAGSGLELLLRSMGISHMILAGISTSGVVLSTLRQAADMDFELTVLADACLDNDAEVHRVLVEKIFPRQADVLSVEQWNASLG